MDKIREAKTKVQYTGERVVNKNDKEQTAVEYCEKHYPEMMKEYKKITDCRTDSDIKLSLTGLWFRINDKVQRLKQLVILGQPDEVGESVQDTFQDLSVYGMIAQIVQNGKWGKK